MDEQTHLEENEQLGQITDEHRVLSEAARVATASWRQVENLMADLVFAQAVFGEAMDSLQVALGETLEQVKADAVADTEPDPAAADAMSDGLARHRDDKATHKRAAMEALAEQERRGEA